jgi:serine-type D-Ala-D-Ala carboxypeptidase (penicillin-binding protein 5/6)
MSRQRYRSVSLVWLVAAGAFFFGATASAAYVPLEPLPPRPGGLVAPPPNVSAPSWVLFDESSDWLIAARDPDSARPIASTTKMLTALVAAEFSTFDELVTVSASAAEAGEAEIGLVAGEIIPMGDLVSAILVRSANDAAEAIAEHVGGSVEGFADLMNQKAEEMGLTNSHFVNPHGLDTPGHYSSAADLLQIARAVLANPQLAAMVKSTSIDFPPAPDGTPRGGPTTNLLLETYDGAVGVKTGFTLQASLVLAAAAERDGRLLLAVVMGSEGAGGHFADAAALLDYGFGEAAVGESPQNALVAARMEQAARIETLTWLAASGLLSQASDPATRTEVFDRVPADLPGWREAFWWAPRYWAWLAGDR